MLMSRSISFCGQHTIISIQDGNSKRHDNGNISCLQLTLNVSKILSLGSTFYKPREYVVLLFNKTHKIIT